MSNTPSRDQLDIGMRVSVVTKEDQRTDNLTDGVIRQILTSSKFHPHGIKVKLENGHVGRVKKILDSASDKTPNSAKFVDLSTKEIPKVENKENEFKEFYQYDAKIDKLSATSEHGAAIKGIKENAKSIIATAVCSFGNSNAGGFVYLGIKDDGAISGLEKDKKLDNFVDYDDSFANNILDGLGNFLKDKIFLTTKLQIKFRAIDAKTICIIQVLPADKPIYHGRQKSFFVRGPTPRAIKLDNEEQYRYIKERFPDHR